MTFDEVKEIICSYGFYCVGDDQYGHLSMYYKYPGIDRLAIYAENFSNNYPERVDVITFQHIVLWNTGDIGINYADNPYKLWRNNIHSNQFKLTEEQLHKKLYNYKIWLESLIQAQKIMKMNKKLEKMENDFD
jgi:hypothetical protein